MDKEQEKDDAGKRSADGEKEKKLIAVVLKIDMHCHCQGCVRKICNLLRRLPGVETVSVDLVSDFVRVTGIVDPLKIMEELQNLTKKKVDLISDQEIKPSTPVTTAVLKLSFHCYGCTEKIRTLISKTKGLHDFSMDDQKEQVTVTGTMDVKSLMEDLEEKLKRAVNIVPPEKEMEKEGCENVPPKKEKEKDGDGNVPPKKEKEKEGGEHAPPKKEKEEEGCDNGDGNGKNKEGDDNGGGNGKNNNDHEEEEKGQGGTDQMMKLITPQNGVESVEHGGYGDWYGPAYSADRVHAPQLFSDENPNACAVI